MTQGWNDAIPGTASLGYYSSDKVDPTIMGRRALLGRNIRPMMVDSVRRIIIAIIISCRLHASRMISSTSMSVV
jgi:hypothetical protein